ncbi:MAG: signal peptidase I [Patescibacteria group bacterium]
MSTPHDNHSTEFNTPLQSPESVAVTTPQPEEKEEHPLVEIIRFSIIALIIVIPIRMFVAQPFIVSGASMDDTFHSGEYLIVDQVTYQFEEPQRGDVVIFRFPKDPSKFFIKRVIAIPGDTIEISGTEVKLINETYPGGLVLDEPYIKSMRPGPATSETLGEREYFVMGDNRDESSDSRAWGLVQEDQIIGRAFLRLFPPTELDYLPGEAMITGEEVIRN